MSGIEILIGSALTAAAESVGSIGLGTALQAAGTAAAVGGTLAAGAAAKQSASFEAKQAKANATTERAASQRDAELERRRAEMVVSEQRAKAAAGGGGLGGSALDIMSSTLAEGKLRENLAYYGGKERAADWKNRASAAKFKGAVDYAGSMLDAASAGITGGYNIGKSRGAWG